MPAEKICEKINKKDSQICELKYGEQSFHFLLRVSSCFTFYPPSAVVSLSTHRQQ